MSTHSDWVRVFRIGTRGSALALIQAEMVVAALRAVQPQLAFTIERVTTGGDRDRQTSLAALGGQGVFVREIENALCAGKIDLAVHSLKDMPVIQPEGLVIGAVLERGDPRDALVSRFKPSLEALPPGARVGTSSSRRALQVLAQRPDVQTADIRGNVDTRLRKVAAGEFDAAILAMAGLVRLGRVTDMVAPLPPEIMLPAVGQGAIAVEVRAEDAEALGLVQAIDHAETRAAVTAERSFLRALGGGCHMPIAGYAVVSGGELHLRGLVAGGPGGRSARGAISGPCPAAEQLGRDLAQRLLQQGCESLLVEAAAYV